MLTGFLFACASTSTEAEIAARLNRLREAAPAAENALAGRSLDGVTQRRLDTELAVLIGAREALAAGERFDLPRYQETREAYRAAYGLVAANWSGFDDAERAALSRFDQRARSLDALIEAEALSAHRREAALDAARAALPLLVRVGLRLLGAA